MTSGVSGIDRATASVFARKEANVVAADVDVEGNEETARPIKKAGFWKG